MSSPRPNLCRRVTASVPLLATVIVHVVLLGVVGYFVTEIIGNGGMFKATIPSESITQKKAGHRLQVVRKGGGSASLSPRSASRIFFNLDSVLRMPAMPDLPSVATSLVSGIGFSKGIGAEGPGNGGITGTSISCGGGIGFTTVSFFGMPSQQVSKVVFIVDVGRGLLDIRKGGFEAFEIIREETMKCVVRLPPQAEFNVVLYESGWNAAAVVSFSDKLLPATVHNKQEFLNWLAPVNATPDHTGIGSARGRRVQWTPKDISSAGLDPMLNTPEWSRALHFALEMEPDTIFVIDGGEGHLSRDATSAELERRKREQEESVAELRRQGLDVEAVAAAREKAMAKARAELNEVNAKMRATGKSPFIIADTRRIFESDFQEALEREGFAITLDKSGWTDKDGQLIWGGGYSDVAPVPFSELVTHISKLKRALVKDQVAINFSLFVGPDEKPTTVMENLSDLTRRNNGKFDLITTRRLKELVARDAK